MYTVCVHTTKQIYDNSLCEADDSLSLYSHMNNPNLQHNMENNPNLNLNT